MYDLHAPWVYKTAIILHSTGSGAHTCVGDDKNDESPPRKKLKIQKKRIAVTEFQIQITFLFLNSKRTHTLNHKQTQINCSYAEIILKTQIYVGIFVLFSVYIIIFVQNYFIWLKTLLYNQYHQKYGSYYKYSLCRMFCIRQTHTQQRKKFKH